MIFSDLIFVFAFLPIYIVLSFSCREQWSKNAVSVAASLIFISWGRPWHIWYYALIILPVFLIYIFGLFAKRFSPVIAEAAGDAVAVLYAAFAITVSGTEMTLRSALISVGFILFALRSISYMKDVSEGMKPEKDFLCLAYYLISFENMLIAPLLRYGDVRESIADRKTNLSKMSAGLTVFIKGFAKTAVLGLAFDRVRLAAISGTAFPWANAVALILVSFGEFYVVTSGVLGMSQGISLMNGITPFGQAGAFIPRCRVSDHLAELCETFPSFVRACFFERSSVGLIVSMAGVSLLSGIFLSLGAGVAAFVGILILAVILEAMAPRRSKAADIAFSAVMLAVGFFIAACGSPDGMSRFFFAFTADYGYDITYSLNEELLRALPWLAIGVISVTPLTRWFSALIRSKMMESDSFYAAARIAETVLCSLLLILATAAAAV